MSDGGELYGSSVIGIPCTSKLQ